MKACVLEEVGKLEYKDVEMPQIKDDEVLLKIEACGICSSDIDRVFKTGTYNFPTIPGHEFSGEIVAIGNSVEAHYFGKHATVFPLKPCFQCDSCKQQQYARCESYDYYGSRCDGAFAEYLAVKKWNLYCYEGVTSKEAAMCEPASVALHAVKNNVQEGDTVLVIGTGTIGYLVAMWSDILGADKVIIAGRNEKKLQFANELQIPNIKTLNSTQPDYIEKLQEYTDKKLADVVVECVGSNESIAMAILSVKKGGTVIAVGNPEGKIDLERDVYWKLLRKELTLKGSWNSEVSDIQNNWITTLECMKNKKLQVGKLITHTFKLRDYQKAFEVLRNKDEFSVKVMLVNEDIDE